MNYVDFIRDKAQWKHDGGFTVGDLPESMFPFQEYMTRWALSKGRSALFADCGLGKSIMELVWGQQIVERQNKPVLLATPIAVGAQMVKEAEKFGIPAVRSRNGEMPKGATVVITNYEQLHKFDPMLFAGFIGDESSCIKDAKSARKADVVEFCRRLDYRLFCTATAAPNDFFELGTTSEALGLLGFRDMITTFFKQEGKGGRHAWGRTKYRFRGHAEEPFWAWVCSWARSMRKPSDLGFDDYGYDLPELIEREIVIPTTRCRPGQLMATPASTLQEEREERRLSITERCEKAMEIVESHRGPSVMWCELNEEGRMLRQMVSNSVEITGSMPDEKKEEYLTAFSNGEIDRLITKPKIGAWGLNWQHCCNTVTFPSHSFEQYYQVVRRFYRFGQQNPVTVTAVVTEGEEGVLRSLNRKAAQAERMFQSIVSHMRDSMHLVSEAFFPEQEIVPAWL